jgi:hypothetical protein
MNIYGNNSPILNLIDVYPENAVKLSAVDVIVGKN